jgi:transcriptional regulator with XRE-family HTH domain
MGKFEMIAERMKEFRKSSGLSQANIACFLGVDQSLISKAENGERNLSVDMLEKLAALYGVSMLAFEENTLPVNPLKFALRADELTTADMETISAINRIALNSEFMADLLAGEQR